MSLSEFSLIQQYFLPICTMAEDSSVALGIGDDAAVVNIPDGMQLAISSDTLVAGVHFPENSAPADIARRALRVNLSDLAAMGAKPRWFTLSLTLPEASPDWLAAFAAGLAADARRFDCTLVGGDTTSGAFTITIQVMGLVPSGDGLTRANAQPGDLIYVTGTLGEGAAALDILEPKLDLDQKIQERLFRRFYRPQPRIAEGIKLRGIANAMIDVSDGLLADLGHILERSNEQRRRLAREKHRKEEELALRNGDEQPPAKPEKPPKLGAEIALASLPIPRWLTQVSDADTCRNWALGGGDDYELCFTVALSQLADLLLLIEQGEIKASCIGQVTDNGMVRCLNEMDEEVPIVKTGYRHF